MTRAITTAATQAGREHVPLHHPLRWVTALLLVAAGALHIPVTPEHLREAPYIGALFIALTVVCFLLALALPVRDTPLVWAIGGMVTTLAVLAYVLSRSVALPQIADDVGNWTEPLGLASIASETLVSVFAVVVLVTPTRTAAPPP